MKDKTKERPAPPTIAERLASIQLRVNAMFQLAPPPWRCADLNDLMRIAVTCG